LYFYEKLVIANKSGRGTRVNPNQLGAVGNDATQNRAIAGTVTTGATAAIAAGVVGLAIFNAP